MARASFSPSRRLQLALGLALLVFALPAPLWAQTDSNVEASQHAVTLGHEALERFESGEYVAALERFERAESATHSPVFVLYMARCHASLGQLLLARELFGQVAGESLPDAAPEAWRNARESATQELEKLATQVPSLLVLIEGPDKPPYTIAVGEHAKRTERQRHQLELDPGQYDVVVTNAEGERVERHVSLAPGQREQLLRVTFSGVSARKKPDPNLRSAKRRKATAPDPAPRREPNADNVSAWTALGVGIAATAIGLAAGTVAWVKARDVRSECSGGRCPSPLRDDAQSARTWANVATVGLAVGVVGLGSGLLLWDDPSPAPAAAMRAPGVVLSTTF